MRSVLTEGMRNLVCDFTGGEFFLFQYISIVISFRQSQSGSTLKLAWLSCSLSLADWLEVLQNAVMYGISTHKSDGSAHVLSSQVPLHSRRGIR